MQQLSKINKKSQNILANIFRNSSVIQINSKSYANQTSTSKNIEERNRSIYFLTKFDPNESVSSLVL